MIRTKVCGIASVEDMRVAEDSGTDAIGFLVGQKHNAIGFIEVDFAKKLRDIANPFISTVVVTHIEVYKDLYELASYIKPNCIQLHSDLELSTVKRLKKELPELRIICKVSIQSEKDIEKASRLQSHADAILLDTIDLINDKVGGTGLTHDWGISKKVVESINKPVILAGGLNPENVVSAIKRVKPFAVDVNSGVTINGRKDFALVNKFIYNAKFH